MDKAKRSYEGLESYEVGYEEGYKKGFEDCKEIVLSWMKEMSKSIFENVLIEDK